MSATAAGLSEPVMGEPVVGEPAVGEPAITEPVMREPVMSEPVMGEPVLSGRASRHSKLYIPPPGPSGRGRTRMLASHKVSSSAGAACAGWHRGRAGRVQHGLSARSASGQTW